MKNSITFLFAIAVMVIATGCASTYPRQSKGTKPVPEIKSCFLEMPRELKTGKVTWIHDQRKEAFVVFKGQDDEQLLEAMNTWLHGQAEGEDSTKTPIVLTTGTDIDPLILFTRKDLRDLSKEPAVADNTKVLLVFPKNNSSKTVKDQVIAMTQYRSYSITIPRFAYVQDLTKEELEAYHYYINIPSSNSSVNQQTRQSSNDNRYKVKRSDATNNSGTTTNGAGKYGDGAYRNRIKRN